MDLIDETRMYEMPFSGAALRLISDQLSQQYYDMVKAAVVEQFRKELGVLTANDVPEDELSRLSAEVSVVSMGDNLTRIYAFRGVAFLKSEFTLRDNRIGFDFTHLPPGSKVIYGANGPVAIAQE